ncbi:unnamed protein product [Spirodela intermedia]|uniref:Auxin-responsive protein n=1 Tax=Spirodela intermedia TaxID=51605 RepID=A0A7I8I852_SPIIN|nr:unnamed protein product [Spirodela intermedia]CAA6653826.1 unnamed protein product [Spirodela intermedia]
MRRQGSSPSSSIDSSSHPCPSDTCSSISQPTKRDLSTDLRLGIGLWTSTTRLDGSFTAREYHPDWPPIKPLLRSALAGKGAHRQQSSFFVKVYMEGLPIGRKVDLFVHQGYEHLLRTLRGMFSTAITCPDLARSPSEKTHVLTYEDKEGDWMVVGDVPWEMFLTSVKRLKITRADKC